MSVTGDYMLILGKDRPEVGTEDRNLYDLGLKNGLTMFDKSTWKLKRAIESVDWEGDLPVVGMLDSSLTYFWWGTRGPFYRDTNCSPPLESLIDGVRVEYPELDRHYSLLVWCEGELQRIDGHFAEHNIQCFRKTVMIPRWNGSNAEDMVDIRADFQDRNDLNSEFKRRHGGISVS